MTKLWHIVRFADTKFLELYMAVLSITVGVALLVHAQGLPIFDPSKGLSSAGITGACMWLVGLVRGVGLLRESYPVRRSVTMVAAFLWLFLGRAAMSGTSEFSMPPASWGYFVGFMFNAIIYIRLRGQK
jgi:hypothetical protein